MHRYIIYNIFNLFKSSVAYYDPVEYVFTILVHISVRHQSRQTDPSFFPPLPVFFRW